MGTTQRSDADLVAEIHDGDGAGWAEVWARYGDRLFGYARRHLGDDADASDAVSDTFLAAAEHLRQLREPEHLRAWLYAICRRQVQARWRHRARVTPVDEMTELPVHDTTEMEAGVAAAEAQRFLWAAAEGLPPSDRDLLTLALDADLDSGEIARVTGAAPDSVYVKVSRLKTTLARSAGALYVARHGRADCADLAELLGDWDGTLTPRWRKRIARHVDGCEVCEQRRSAAATMAATPAMALVAAPAGLGDDIVGELISAVRPGPRHRVPFDRQGWPRPGRWGRARWAGLVVAGVAVLAAVVGVVGVSELGGDRTQEVATEAGGDVDAGTTLPDAAPAEAVPVPGGATSTGATTTPGRTGATAPPATDGPTTDTTPTTRPSSTTSPTTDTTDPSSTSSSTTDTTRPPRAVVRIGSLNCSRTGVQGSVTANGVPGDSVVVTWSGDTSGNATLGPQGGSFVVAVRPPPQGGAAVAITAELRGADGKPLATTTEQRSC